jgi:multidrug efflux system membrane fusion protein
MRRPLLWLIVLGPSLVAAAAAVQLLRQSPPTAAAATGRSPPAVAVPVVAGVAEARDVPIYLSGIGTVQAFNTVTVKPRVDGELQQVAFTEGQDVKAGDLLAQIDSRPFAAALAQAKATKARDEAQLANARLDLDRYSTLAQRDFASKQSVDTQKALVAQFEAAVQGDDAAIDNATVQLGYTRITAPLAGRTGARLIDAGNIVHAADPNGLVVITQLKPISVIFTLPQDVLDEVAAAMAQGPLKVFAYKRDDVTSLGDGQLTLLDNQIDPATGTVRLKATFPNDDLRLWPGQFVNARLLVTTRHDAVTVPAQVVQRGPKGPYAYVIKPDQTAEARPVKLGQVRDGVALIEQGLATGEQVVVDGQYKVTAGARLNAAPAKISAAGPAS